MCFEKKIRIIHTLDSACNDRVFGGMQRREVGRHNPNPRSSHPNPGGNGRSDAYAGTGGTDAWRRRHVRLQPAF